MTMGINVSPAWSLQGHREEWGVERYGYDGIMYVESAETEREARDRAGMLRALAEDATAVSRFVRTYETYWMGD